MIRDRPTDAQRPRAEHSLHRSLQEGPAMQFAREPLVGSSPYPYDLAWRQVHDIPADVGQVFSLLAGAVLCIATFALWIVAVPFHPVHIDYATLIVAAAMVLFVHELSHAAVFTCGRDRGLRVECVWQKYRPHLRYRGAVSRSRYIAVLLAPLMAITLMPIVASVALSLHSGDLVVVSVLNALVSGGDVLAAALVLLQVPANGIVQRRGDCVIWKSARA
jgi:hypothetical protein